MQTEIFFIRHGEPVLQNALLGSTDSPLSEVGWQQLLMTGESLGDLDLVVTSPLARCALFAQEFSEQKSLPLQIEDYWRECHFGEWDGEFYLDLHQSFPEAVSAFFADPGKNTPPKGESLSNFSQRIEKAVLTLNEQFKGKRIAVFTHAGVIRTLVAWCLQMDYMSGLQFRRFAVDYASVTHLSLYNDDKVYPQLVSLNSQVSEKKVVDSTQDEKESTRKATREI